MGKHVIFLFVMSLCCLRVNAQGKVIFEESPDLTYLMNKFVKENRENSTIKGWRIQLISTPDRRRMDETRSKFAFKYPQIPLQWNHVSPNYQVRVGAYYSKPELMDFLLKLRKDFPMATPVIDVIDKVDLIPN